MAGETTITVIGNLTSDPELKFTPSGAAVANFTIASTPRTFDKTTNEWVDGDALFLNAAAWRELAENVSETLTKGMRVIAVGQLKVRNYERQDGSKGTSVDLLVESIGPDLKWASAKVTRANRGGGGGGGGRQAPANDWGHTGQPSGATQRVAASDPWSTAPPPSGQQSMPEEPPF